MVQRRFSTLAALLLTAVVGVACGDAGDERPGGMDLDSDPQIRTQSDEGPCTDGVVRECTVYLPEQNGVQDCFTGLQLCAEGEWGACEHPDEVGGQLLAETSAP